ncbi:MAG: T9SS type A sorting domain-containing protein [Candidatus Cloacimonadota bacterium]|nr:T9SS type A sorting domain-containing protein [Candidatus Cloacimonadota bacterium]
MKKIFFSLTVFFLLLSTPCLAGEWNLTGSLNQGRSEFPSVLLDDGQILVAGGIIGCYENSSCEIYDPETGQWSPTDSMSYAVANFSLTKLPDGKILAVYGMSSEIFDPETETWSEIATLNFSRHHHSAVLLQNSRVLAVGGDSANDYKGCEIYNPQTNEWTLTGFCSHPKLWHTLELLPDGQVMAIGGGNSSYEHCEIYDPNTELWTEIASLNESRYNHTSHLLPNGNVMAIAGGPEPYRSSCEIYDFQTQQWTYADSLEIGRTNHCSEKLLNNKILVMGGQGETGSGSGHSCEIYNPTTNQWQIAASLYHSYGNFSSEILKDERVLAIRSWCEIYTWNYTPTVNLAGPNEATVGETLSFSITATDPDNDSLAVRIDWGDDEISEWTELQPSGTTFELSHSWTEPGQYQVRAQSADQWYFQNPETHNSLSNWSQPLIITITGHATDPSVNPVETEILIYPNPFRTSTTISFSNQQSLPTEASAQAGGINNQQFSISIFNLKGQKIKTFPNLQINKSSDQQIVWDGRDANGKPVPSGIYFCHLENSSYCSTKKILVFK